MQTILSIDELFYNDPTHVKKDKTRIVPLMTLPCVPGADKEPVSVIEPDIEYGPWIAGGACIKWHQSQVVAHSDIDIFCKNQKQANDVVARIKGYNRSEIICQTKNATTLRYFACGSDIKYWVLQVITVNFYERIEDIIATFDISVCQIATAGTEWVLGPTTIKDLKNNVLRFIGRPRSCSLKRLLKYWSYGYIPLEGTLERIQQSPETIWSYENDDVYENFGI